MRPLFDFRAAYLCVHSLQPNAIACVEQWLIVMPFRPIAIDDALNDAAVAGSPLRRILQVADLGGNHCLPMTPDSLCLSRCHMDHLTRFGNIRGAWPSFI